MKPPTRPTTTAPGAPKQPVQGTQHAFLKVSDLHSDGHTGCAIGAPFRLLHSQYGVQLVVTCVLDNSKVFDWGVRVGSSAYIALERKFGKNLFLWDEKTLELRQEPMRDGSGSYIAVVE